MRTGHHQAVSLPDALRARFAGVSARAAAEHFDVKKPTYTGWLGNDKRGFVTPSPERYEGLMLALGVTLDELGALIVRAQRPDLSADVSPIAVLSPTEPLAIRAAVAKGAVERARGRARKRDAGPATSPE